MVSTMQVEGLGLRDCYEPIGDYTAPTQAQLSSITSFISLSLSEGRPVGVSCGAGMGRTGTILACYLISTGLNAEDAMQEVRTKRPGSIETEGQEQAIRAFAFHMRNPN
jgi:atypical dual specificity phosphatase